MFHVPPASFPSFHLAHKKVPVRSEPRSNVESESLCGAGVDARAPAAIRCYGFPSREHGPGLIGRGTGWNPDRVPMKRDGEPSIPNRIGELLGRVVGAVVVQDRCWRASSSVHRHGLLRDSCRRMQERTVFLPDVEEFQDHGGVPIATRPSSGRRSASNDGCTGVARLFVQPSADRRRH